LALLRLPLLPLLLLAEAAEGFFVCLDLLAIAAAAEDTGPLDLRAAAVAAAAPDDRGDDSASKEDTEEEAAEVDVAAAATDAAESCCMSALLRAFAALPARWFGLKRRLKCT
jgi:hypothetical protein